jgi:hypothetical protein
MKRTVDISTGVGDQRDLADLELGAGGVQLSRLQAAQVVADHRRWQAFVSDHAVFDAVAQLEQLLAGVHRSLGRE